MLPKHTAKTNCRDVCIPPLNELRLRCVLLKDDCHALQGPPVVEITFRFQDTKRVAIERVRQPTCEAYLRSPPTLSKKSENWWGGGGCTQAVMYSPHARHVGSQVNQRGLLWLVKTTTTRNNNRRCDTVSPAVYNTRRLLRWGSLGFQYGFTR